MRCSVRPSRWTTSPRCYSGSGSGQVSAAASALEFALEGLHLSRRLNKTTTAGGARYGG